MNSNLKTIQDLLQQNNQLTEQDREVLSKAIADADKQWTITDFKLERTEKVKKTTEILLEETIEELEQKRKAVEGQNRELQIEAALERVRARTMAMHQSNELADTASILFQQIKELGFETWSCGFCIWTKNDLAEIWMAADSGGLLPPMMIPYKEEPTHSKIFEASLCGEPAHDKIWEGKELEKHYTFLKTIPSVKEAIEILEKSGLTLPARQCYYVGFFKQGYLLLITKEPNAELKDLSKRFASVFDLTYTRFLDLQKSEAQARESQIQLGLERVRARAMAMQTSEELNALIGTVFTELTKLDLTLVGCDIIIFDIQTNSSQWWMVNSEAPTEPLSFFIKYHQHPPYLAFIDAWKQRKLRWVYDLKGNTKKEWDDFLFNETELSLVPSRVIANMTGLESVLLSSSFNNFGCLNIGTREPLSEEHFDILLRFAKVFDLTYTRFNDLQKAEAQAREAQIELGLERVRARAMAMQKSDELSELVDTVFKELTKLDFALTWCIINIIDESSMSNTVWAANPDINKAPESYHMLFEDYPFHHAMMKGWKERKTKYVYTLEGSEKKIYDDYLFSETEFKRTPEAAQAASRAMEKYVVSFSFSNFGGLQTVGDAPLSDANLEILSRFGKVFDLTYTRFNDLKQAEAQARESQIQLAMERVRARTMAMHHSGELAEVATVLFEQMSFLDNTPERFNIRIINEAEKAFEFWATDQEGHLVNKFFKAEFDKSPVVLQMYNAWKAKEKILIQDLYGDQLSQWVYYIKDVLGVPFNMEHLKEHRFLSSIFFSHGMIGITTNDTPKGETLKLIERFAKVFEQTYTRFLDLQKSEAQARESQIEAALERVRSRSMGMQKSDELKEVIQVVYEQFVHLNINTEHTGFVMDYKTRDDYDIWIADKLGVPSHVTIPYFDSVYYNRFNEAKEKGIDFFATNLGFEEKNRFYEKIIEYVPGLPEETKKFLFSIPGLAVSTVLLENVGLYIENFSGIPYSDEENNMLMRFGKVFQQTYTRFLDLQKAEAQARESQIEASLERVRARAMGMQNSDELRELIGTVFTELTKLDLALTRCVIWIIDKETNAAQWWMANSEDENYPGGFYIKYHEHHPYLTLLNEWKKQNVKCVYDLNGLVKKEWDDFLFSKTDLVHLPQFVQDGMRAPDRVLLSASFNNFGGINVASLEPLSDEHFDILLRFAKVFDLTYTRFNDLKQAEAQAREAKIEAALEKVRGRAMAMHKSDELLDAGALLYSELSKLGVEKLTSGYMLVDEDEKMGWNYGVNPATGQIMSQPVGVSLTETKVLRSIVESWKKQEPLHIIQLDPQETIAHQTYMAEKTVNFPLSKEKLLAITPERLVIHTFNFKQGWLLIVGGILLTTEQQEIIVRFSKVFEMTYRRFLDLQKAEAQAREAKIEAALEKVRSRTMAMQHSDELADVAQSLFQQVKDLGITAWTTGFNIWHPDNTAYVDWITGPRGDFLEPYTVHLTGHPTFRAIREARLRGDDFFVSYLEGEQIIETYQLLSSFGDKGQFQKILDSGIQFPTRQFNHFVFGAQVSLLFITYEPVPEAHAIFKRFGKVFEQTYTRFLDLQKAEGQARAAKIEAALERVRARALAMQEPEELKDVAQVLRTEMGLLGVEELETCSIYINDESAEKAECWYALKDIRSEEKKLVNDHFALNLNDTWVGREMLEFYQSPEKQVSIVMQGENRKEWIRYCEEKSASLRGYYGEVIPDRTYHLYKFSHGAIGAAAAGDISEESWRMLSRAASVFTLAYSRFKDLTQALNDLIKLKEEKKRAEDALTELQVTQKQLIQSEKMASLGELTAGIAHEIQNPLNFVNNFSDVSNELLEEMKTELEKGNTGDAMAIVEDVKQNLEKILHHGKRADAIVKGMLQHSRSSSGVKEPTDINTLADEYLRLAYHGLRAKDKSFNALMKTGYDENIGKVNVVPQDVGRSVLNLITNAFYAVAEKKKQNAEGYEPTVTVTTKKINARPDDPVGRGKIEIRVGDNGNGIPQKVLDKIFQPFFTTKPTGEGTGLGLSLSYDIITKGHGGELKVETTEGEGSDFIISIPITNN